MDNFYNIHEYHRSDVTNTHDIAYFITILLKALPDVIPIPFCNSNNQEKNVIMKRVLMQTLLYRMLIHFSFLIYGLIIQDESKHLLV